MNIRALYQEMLLDHGRHPRNFGLLEAANHTQVGYNPVCGDEVIVYLQEKAGTIEKVMFDGHGCAISMASASLMTQLMQGKSKADVDAHFEVFHHLLTHGALPSPCEVSLGKCEVLAGVSAYPARVKCATLAWHTLMQAFNNQTTPVTTELTDE